AGNDCPPRIYPAKRDQLRASFGLFINTRKILTTSPLTLLRSPISRSSALKVEKSRNWIRCFLAVTGSPPSSLLLRFNPQSGFSPALHDRIAARLITSPMESFDVVIVGAGAAGLMCAMTAGNRGRRVL